MTACYRQASIGWIAAGFLFGAIFLFLTWWDGRHLDGE